MKFDIPINFTVEADDEEMAEYLLRDMLKRMVRRYGLFNLIQYENFEFIVAEPGGCGCGDNDDTQGKPLCCGKQACNNPH